MGELTKSNRAIELKKQAVPLIRREIHETEERFCFKRPLRRLEARINDPNYDQADTSERIDCIQRPLED